MTSADPFDVPGVAWVRLGPGLIRERRLVVVLLAGLLLGGLGVATVLRPERAGWWGGLAVLVLLLLGVAWRVIDRSVRAWGYAERDDDVIVTRGVSWRRIDVVPYGRMQMVDVSSGPLDRMFGLATVRLHTASPTTSGRIPGLAPAEAARLRDRLTRRGEVQATGL